MAIFNAERGNVGLIWFDMFFTPFHIMVATDIPLKNMGQFRPTNGHCTKAKTGDLLVAGRNIFGYETEGLQTSSENRVPVQ